MGKAATTATTVFGIGEHGALADEPTHQMEGGDDAAGLQRQNNIDKVA